MRLVPDVSMAAAGHDGYALCLDASCEGSNPGFAILSGTSASAQVFGGVMALVDQKVGGRVGVANFALYKLAATETLASCNASAVLPAVPPAGTCIFNDVTVGDTNLTIVVENGFAAGAGYDEATGLGSVNVTNLVNNWHSAVSAASTTTLSLNGGTAVTITHGTSVPVSIMVAAATGPGTPTGDVSLIATSSTDQGVDAFKLDSTGKVNSTTTLLPGSGATPYQLHAHYGGDGTFLGSDSAPVTVTVNPETSQIALGLTVVSSQGICTPLTSVTYGSPYVLAVTVADKNVVTTPCVPNESGSSPTGTVTLTDRVGTTTGPLDGGTFKLNAFGEFEDQAIQLPVGTHTISATYSGDPSFSASGPATTVITVSKATTTTSVSANPMAVATGASVTLTANIQAPQSNAFATPSQEPGGTVQFLANGAPFGSPVAVNGIANSSQTPLAFAQSIATFSTTALNAGQNVITAQYSGDGNYLASTTTSSVNVSVGVPGVNVQAGCASSTITIGLPGQSGTCVVTVSGANNFSGNVALTCGLSGGPSGATDLPTCSIAPASVTISSGSGTGTATLTVGTTAASHLFAPPSHRQGPDWLLISEIGAALACLFLLVFASRERRGVVTFAAVLFITMAAITGCSGGNSSGTGITGNPGTTTGTYTVSVKATPAGGTATLLPVTVNVQ
jgi:hypothetical protein